MVFRPEFILHWVYAGPTVSQNLLHNSVTSLRRYYGSVGALGERIPPPRRNTSNIASEYKDRVKNVKFATYLKFATCGNTNTVNDLR